MLCWGRRNPLETSCRTRGCLGRSNEVDEHLGAAIAGLGPDARVLIEQVRAYAQSNRLMYDEPVDVELLTKHIGDIKQLCTQRIWIRPFGVSLILGGVDKTGNRVFKTDPSGSYRSYKAAAEGAGRETVESVLKEEYRGDMTLDDAIKLTVRCLMNDLEARKEEARIRIAVVPAETKRFTVFTGVEVDKYKKAVEKIDKNK